MVTDQKDMTLHLLMVPFLLVVFLGTFRPRLTLDVIPGGRLVGVFLRSYATCLDTFIPVVTRKTNALNFNRV